MLGGDRAEKIGLLFSIALLCGECRYVFWKTAGFDLQNQKLFARELSKGQTGGQPAAKLFSSFKGVPFKGQFKSLKH